MRFKEIPSFFGLEPDSFGLSIELDTQTPFLRNKIVELFLSEELKPPWLKEEYVRIYVPEIYKMNNQGKMLGCFEFADNKLPAITQMNNKIMLGFDPEQTIRALLNEEYFKRKRPLYSYLPFHYHKIKSRVFLNRIQTKIKKRLLKRRFPSWPIEPSVEVLRYLILNLAGKEIPGKNFWPNNKKYAIAFTHDVDTEEGFNNIPMLSKIEEDNNLTSSWNIVGHSYKLDLKYLDVLVEQGNEIVLHGFNHDNKLAYIKNEDIELRFQQCQELLQRYNIKGFRSPSLLRSDRLFGILPKFFQYDSSIPDTEIFSPIGNHNGCCTVFPFFINNLLELPLTIPQDAVLLNLGYSPEEIFSVWINKLNWIKSIGALAVINTHPDPHYSGNTKMSRLYGKFIETIVRDSNAWIANPKEIAEFWIMNRNPRT